MPCESEFVNAPELQAGIHEGTPQQSLEATTPSHVHPSQRSEPAQDLSRRQYALNFGERRRLPLPIDPHSGSVQSLSAGQRHHPLPRKRLPRRPRQL